MATKLSRFQVDMLEERARELDELATQLGVTKKELFNSALTLLDWAIRQRRMGRTVCSIDDGDNIVEIEMPLLNAASRAQSETPRRRELQPSGRKTVGAG